MKDCELVVLDIDGTTANSKGELTDYTINTIRKVVDKGIPVCLCTGRNVRNALPIAKQLNVKTPFIAIDGAVMYDTQKNKVITEKVIPKDVLKEISQIANKYDVYMEFCTFNNYIKYLKRDELKKYAYGGIPKNTLEKAKFFYNGVRVVRDLKKIYKLRKNINQFLIGGDSESIKKLLKELKEKNYPNIILRDDLWDEYIFVTAENAIKSEGVKLLCEHYGVDNDKVIAMGDQMNDVDMIMKAGFGIAMGNAHDKIKDIAKHVTMTNDEDGVAKALEKFVL